MSPFSELLDSCRNIYAIGRNYRAHAEELSNPVPSQPLLFSKATASLCSGTTLSLPQNLGSIHHELEIVMRIGEQVEPGHFRDLSCCSHIGLGIDFTARDLQTQLKQKGHPWLRAKSFQSATFLGPLQPFQLPWRPLQFQLSRNDQLVQDGDTRHMIFPIPQFLKELNANLALTPGDLIFTGTPAGVGPVLSGDTLQLQCEGLNLDFKVRVH